MNKIQNELFAMQDIAYKSFQAKLIPTLDSDAIIGVRTPMLRKFSSGINGSNIANDFLNSLPHAYYEENNLHAFLIEKIKNYELCIEATERFLPYIDNWATCDSFTPKIFCTHKTELLKRIDVWLLSEHPYTVRFAIKMLMNFYLDDDFRDEYAKRVSAVRSDEYYVEMMVAWYFATALAKQYDCAVRYLEDRMLPVWIHNKTIQKSCESFRISDEKKEYLKTLKIKPEVKNDE